VLTAALADQAQVCLVDEGRGLKRLARRFVGQPASGQLPQLFIDERQELRRGRRVAGLDGGQHDRDV
jgi:hypothetical protein